MIGTTLGPYQIIEEIGRGGMATVYRAHQPSVGRDVAIKTLLKGIGSDEQAVLRFQREARLVARLEHPHILPVYDFDGACEPPYIVMRLLETGTLKDVLLRQTLSQEEAVYLLRQVSAALDYAHRQGVVHRDVKPSNILIDLDGNAFVADFGIARLTGLPTGLTGSGAMLGTPDYMAPEQASGRDRVDQRADVYALGVVAFQMLAGCLPFAGDNPLGVLMQHLQQPTPNITDMNPALPQPINGVFHCVLSKDVERRYASAGEFFDALSEALGKPPAASANRIAAFAAGERSPGPREAPGTGSSQAAPGEQHRPVSVLFIDASEYNELVEEIKGPETARRAMAAFWQAAEPCILQRGGAVVERSERDLLAMWGTDSAAETDPEQAVFAALEVQEAFSRQARPYLMTAAPDEEALEFPLNIGVHSGMVLLVRDRATGIPSASGSTISLAQRIAQHAHGLILISRETFRAVQGVFSVLPAETLRLRGKREPIEVFQVTRAKKRAFRVQSRGVEGVVTRMVGREAEFKHIQDAFLDALEENEAWVVTILGEAGLGKSRLLDEFDQWSDLRPERFRIYQGRATPAMTGQPYAMLRDLISYRLSILDSDSPAVVQEKLELGIQELTGAPDAEMAHLVGHLCGFDLSASPFVAGLKDDPVQLSGRARQLTLRMFEKVSHLRPQVIELEDVHHADDASIDLLLQLPVECPHMPLLILALARPVLMEQRPQWASRIPNHKVIRLTPLSRRASRELVAEILQKAGEPPKELRDLVVERGEGNPFYIEELIKMLIEDRVITKESPDLWRIETSRIGNLTVPSTLMGVLQARFDSLVYPEKVALQRASVVGRIFYDSAIEALEPGQGAAGDELRLDDLPAILENLERRGFIQRRPGSAFASSREYIFSQSMQRDQIYETLLERQRAAYHAGIAEWIVREAGERANEYRPMIAEHYEKANDLEKAAQYLFLAGESALGVGAYADAYGLLAHALTLIPPDAEAERLPFHLALGQCLQITGDYAPAYGSLRAARDMAARLNRPSDQARALFLLSQIDVQRGDWTSATHYLAQALPLAEAAGQQDALAWTLYGLSDVQFRTGDLEQAREHAETALELARYIGNGAVERNAMNRLATIITAAAKPGTQDRERAAAILEETHRKSLAAGDRNIAMAALVNLGGMIIDYEDERYYQYTHEALNLAREINSPVGIIVSALNLAEGYTIRGKLDLARTLLREGLATARRINSETWMVASAVNVGFFIAACGEVQRGLRLVGAAISHPAAGADIFTELPEAVRLIVAGRLSQAEIEEVISSGAGEDVRQALEDFLAQD
jgi:class 3 adenylate cyclase/tetratricopeptide (TPR) repeat protein